MGSPKITRCCRISHYLYTICDSRAVKEASPQPGESTLRQVVRVLGVQWERHAGTEPKSEAISILGEYLTEVGFHKHFV
jgi:hypothetical protein